MSLALERVQATRARLRLAMLPKPQSESPKGANASWADKILRIPVVGAVVESVGSWWSSAPIRPIAQVASEATTAAIKPVARHHPIIFVLGAGGIGAALFWARPWRWIFRSAIFAGLLPQLLIRVLTTLPIASWMSILGSAVSRSPAGAKSAPGESVGQPATG